MKTTKEARAFIDADEAVQKAREKWVKSKETYHLNPAATGWLRAELDIAKADAYERFKESHAQQQ